MQGFKQPTMMSLANTDVFCHSNSPFYFRGDDGGRSGPRFSDLGELEQSVGSGFDSVNLSGSKTFSSLNSMFNDPNASNDVPVLPDNVHFAELNNNFGSPVPGMESGPFMLPKEGMIAVNGGGGGGGEGSLVNGGPFEYWADSGVAADRSQQTDVSTDTDDKNQYPGVHQEGLIIEDSVDRSDGKVGEQKELRRLAQNREAARKSKIRKKAYVQQLEGSRSRLNQLEQELKRARHQGSVTSGFSGYRSNYADGRAISMSEGAMEFDTEYARWLGEHQRLVNDLRLAVNSHMGESQLRLVVDAVMSHYDEIFHLKSIATKSNMFHILSGMWKTPTERCFMWLGGFRCSELLKISRRHIEPLTDQQLVGICNLQQSSQQAEDALSQGMEALQQLLIDTMSRISSGPQCSGFVTDYMGQMSFAMNNMATLEGFLNQADLLRHQTLIQLRRILTTRQAARALLAINDYKSRLRALSSLWSARPRE